MSDGEFFETGGEIERMFREQDRRAREREEARLRAETARDLTADETRRAQLEQRLKADYAGFMRSGGSDELAALNATLEGKK